MDIGAFESYLPEADAGTDTVVPRGEMVHLSGVRSSDIDGHIVGFHWRQLAGPTITLENALTDIPSFLAPASSGTVTVELEVTDESGHTATDQVDVRINALPRAVAGQDFTVHEGGSGHLNGTSSSDEDGGIQAFSWQQIDGAQVALLGADTSTPEFAAPHIATHLVFRLIVTDDAGGSAEDDVSVAVNLLPIVEAGSNLIVTGGSPTSLDGSASMDRDGSIVEFSWRQLAGEVVVMSGAQTDTMSFVAPHSPGTLQFRLDVTDNQGGQSFDDVTVTVRSPSNNAGQSGGGGAAGIWTLFGLIASAVIRSRSRLPGSKTADSR
jgi:hypothetical protein